MYRQASAICGAIDWDSVRADKNQRTVTWALEQEQTRQLRHKY